MPSLESLLGLAEPEEGAMSIGDLLGFGGEAGDQSNRAYVPAPMPWTSPLPYDFYMPGQPQYRDMQPTTPVPANDIAAQTGGQTTTYMQPQFPDYSDLARMLSNYRWRASGADSQPIPEQYSGDIPPTLLPDFMQMVQAGLPPAVAHAILTQPSYEEGSVPNSPMGPKKGSGPWPYEYKGQEQEGLAMQKQQQSPPLDVPGAIDPMKALRNQLTNRQQNLPTWEGHTPGDDDNMGFIRLPNGQYVIPGGPSLRESPGRSLKYWRNQGNPNSFYWNPAPGTYPVPDYDYGYDKGQ